MSLNRFPLILDTNLLDCNCLSNNADFAGGGLARRIIGSQNVRNAECVLPHFGDVPVTKEDKVDSAIENAHEFARV